VHLERRVHAATPEQMTKHKVDMAWLWHHPPFSWLPSDLTEHITKMSYAQWLPCFDNYWNVSDEEMLTVLESLKEAQLDLEAYLKNDAECHKIHLMMTSDLDSIDYSIGDGNESEDEYLRNFKNAKFEELAGYRHNALEEALDIMEEDGPFFDTPGGRNPFPDHNFYTSALRAWLGADENISTINLPMRYLHVNGQRVEPKAPLQGWQSVSSTIAHPVTRHFCIDRHGCGRPYFWNNKCSPVPSELTTYSLTDLLHVDWDAQPDDQATLTQAKYRDLFGDRFVKQLEEISACVNPADYRVFFAYLAPAI